MVSGTRTYELYSRCDSMTDFKMAVEALRLAEELEKELRDLKACYQGELKDG